MRNGLVIHCRKSRPFSSAILMLRHSWLSECYPTNEEPPWHGLRGENCATTTHFLCDYIKVHEGVTNSVLLNSSEYQKFGRHCDERLFVTTLVAMIVVSSNVQCEFKTSSSCTGWKQHVSPAPCSRFESMSFLCQTDEIQIPFLPLLSIFVSAAATACAVRCARPSLSP